jgi:RimJ/RimL family protein N-acetyltransferase
MLVDPTATGEFEWFGHRADRLRDIERRWQDDGLIGEDSFLAVVLEDGPCIGWVNWRPGRFGAYEIGCALLPEHRGQSHGTEAQRQLVEYLFSTFPIHRLEAGTEVDNLAEQRALAIRNRAAPRILSE